MLRPVVLSVLFLATAAMDVLAGKPMATAMAQYREDFFSFDANNDGVLDGQEIRTQLESKHEENIVSFFAHYDRDDSGTIGFNEYLTFALSAANRDHDDGDGDSSSDQQPPNGSRT